MASNSSNYQLYGIDFTQNPEQRELIRLINDDPERTPVVFCKGSAGTGKTFATLAAALNLVRGKGSKKRYKNIFYVREPVEIGHRLGYLKGTAEEKYGPYLGPLLDNYNHLMAHASVEEQNLSMKLMKRKAKKDQDDEVYESAYYEKLPSDIIPLAPEFMRGRSFDDCIIILDEAQNMNLDELQTMVTRIGNMCKMVIIGSPNQIDVPGQTPEKNDFEIAYEILKPTGLVGFVELAKPMRTSFVVDFDLRFTEYKIRNKK
jgi:predicted ribonuclease YlaK